MNKYRKCIIIYHLNDIAWIFQLHVVYLLGILWVLIPSCTKFQLSEKLFIPQGSLCHRFKWVSTTAASLWSTNLPLKSSHDKRGPKGICLSHLHMLQQRARQALSLFKEKKGEMSIVPVWHRIHNRFLSLWYQIDTWWMLNKWNPDNYNWSHKRILTIIRYIIKTMAKKMACDIT